MHSYDYSTSFYCKTLNAVLGALCRPLICHMLPFSVHHSVVKVCKGSINLLAVSVQPVLHTNF
jgi:hypothetical protein